MKHPVIAASVLSTAIGLALAAQAPAVRAQGANPPQVVKDNMARAMANKLEKCYGINAAAKNDCAEGAHSCAGQATVARDPKSFVLLPGGDCANFRAVGSPRRNGRPMSPLAVQKALPIPARAGIGLRFQHHQAVLDTPPAVAWMEVHTENYMGGGTPLRYLDAIRRDVAISLHGVALSLGSAEGLDTAHIERIRQVAARVEPALMSEHIAWSVVGGTYFADLLPLPMTEESLAVVCRHVDQVQSHFKRRILVENPSTYLRFAHSVIPEWEFMAAVAQRTGCGILCDVNNIYVSAHNHGWDTSAYLAGLPADAIGEIHLAGHSVRALPDGSTVRIDDHGSRVIPEVWALYREAIARFGPVPTLIEWDTDVPPLDVLVGEANHAGAVLAACEARNAAAA